MHNRLTGLDLLRSIIMIFGPVFHASMLYNGAWGFDYQLYKNPWIVDALNLTHPFRMELFFMISGFFSSLLIARKGSEHFIESRIKRVLKPTFGLSLLRCRSLHRRCISFSVTDDWVIISAISTSGFLLFFLKSAFCLYQRQIK